MDLPVPHKCEVIYEDTSSDKQSERVNNGSRESANLCKISRNTAVDKKSSDHKSSIRDGQEPPSSMTETFSEKPTTSPESLYQENSTSNGSTYVEKTTISASPEAHLSKLKSIHRKNKQIQRLRRLRRCLHFFFTHVLGLLAILISIILLAYGYMFSLRNFLVGGCILLLAAVGFLIHICFADRVGANKFDPNSVAFSIAAEDLRDFTVPSIVEPLQPNFRPDTLSGKQQQQQPQEQTTNITSESQPPPSGITLHPGFSNLQVKRMSMVLARMASNSLQVPKHYESNSSNVLNLARRLTMASSVMAGNDGTLVNGSNWMTGSRFRHGVRRSLAWNATGASRFYDRNYD
ncbi:hypothetical protein CSKR_106290 [Clonorchis sinensis]|uniref:Uncharacterized protein n=2 Tax=Clonorchis sinensis TaxID=79923 RepID=A0A8T1M2B2_CLOSI|nr:hypothetical protein CSKR_106290 [Clonorchis sinensis]GAA27922.1 hypothetical protein CLF_109580 [Clonorchis sinensis]